MGVRNRLYDPTALTRGTTLISRVPNRYKAKFTSQPIWPRRQKRKKPFRALPENITFVVQHVPCPHGDPITAPFLPMPNIRLNVTRSPSYRFLKSKISMADLNNKFRLHLGNWNKFTVKRRHMQVYCRTAV